MLGFEAVLQLSCLNLSKNIFWENVFLLVWEMPLQSTFKFFLDICWLRFIFWVICPTLSCLCRWQWGSKICSGAVAVDSAAHTKVEQKKWVRQFWGRTFRSENAKIKELKSDECGNYLGRTECIEFVNFIFKQSFDTFSSLWVCDLLTLETFNYKLWPHNQLKRGTYSIRNSCELLFYVFCKIPGLSML